MNKATSVFHTIELRQHRLSIYSIVIFSIKNHKMSVTVEYLGINAILKIIYH